VFRVWLQTGEVQQITAPPTMRPAVSPDGRFVAHYWMMPDHWALSVSPVESGLPTTTIVLEPTHAERVVRWAPDGRALAYIDRAGGASNLWLQPLDGGPRRKLTHFTEGRIASFDWSRDGSKLAWMRVQEVSDIVAIGLGVAGGNR
jgi:Tol biopolymer transport system component